MQKTIKEIKIIHNVIDPVEKIDEWFYRVLFYEGIVGKTQSYQSPSFNSYTECVLKMTTQIVEEIVEKYAENLK